MLKASVLAFLLFSSAVLGAPKISPKALATGFFTRAYVNRDPSAVDTFVAANVVQHDPSLADGSAAWKAALTATYIATPNITYSIERVIAQDPLVLVHHHSRTVAGTNGTAGIDIFNVTNSLITSHWAIRQAIPEKVSASGNDMFSTLSAPITRMPDLSFSAAATANLALTFWTNIFVKANLTGIDDFVLPPFYQHNPNYPNGLDPIKTAFAGRNASTALVLQRAIAEGDMVGLFSVTGGRAFIDMYRVRDKILEHWDVVQAVPTNSSNPNGFF